jgi:4,5-DOPA dioxygenase extradiol
MQTSNKKAQIVYFSHGGGPLPILGDPGHKALVDFWTQFSARLAKPEAILVISAHWEEGVATLTGAKNPDLFYDYYGFPEQAYEITYPAPGSPELAGRIAGLLQSKNIPARIDPKRGLDHGVFIPLKLMYPAADIPTLQLLLIRGLIPAVHIAVGKALRELMGENILVIGSGSSFHNFAAFRRQDSGALDPANDAFQNWLIETCTGELTQAEREQRLIAWEKAPSARYCHPREEHLIPLHVCLGMSDSPARVAFDDRILGKRNVAFSWWEN